MSYTKERVQSAVDRYAMAKDKCQINTARTPHTEVSYCRFDSGFATKDGRPITVVVIVTEVNGTIVGPVFVLRVKGEEEHTVSTKEDNLQNHIHKLTHL